MNRFAKITSGILLGLILALYFQHWHKYGSINTNRSAAILFTALLFLPIILGYLFKWRIVSIILNSLSIIFCACLIYSVANEKEDTYTVLQKSCENKVKIWIHENAFYPDSYKPCGFPDFFLIARPFTFETGSIGEMPNYAPVIYRFFGDTLHKCEYAYYFIEHKHILKNKSGSLDTILAYFEMDTGFRIIDVSFLSEDQKSKIPTSVNTWREKYGNNKRNLALEVNGNGPQTYYFRYFNRESEETKRIVKSMNEGGFTKEKLILAGKLNEDTRESIMPYSNGKINGTAFFLYDDGDTSSIANYKDGKLDGVKVSLSRKKDTIAIYTYNAGKLIKTENRKLSE